MNNLLKYKGYFGSVEVSIEDKTLHGKLECIDDVITYEAPTVSELQAAFQFAVDDYLETCEVLGRKPNKIMSGTFNIRLGSSLHKQAYLAAKSKKQTLNEFIKKSVESAVEEKKELHFHLDKKHDVSEFSFNSVRRHAEKTNWKEIIEGGRITQWS